MRKLLFMGLLSTLLISPANADEWSALPSKDGAVEIPAQEWSLRPGPRKIRILIHFPDGTKASVQQDTGLMLTLHNWGGTDCVGTASPVVLARKLNVVAICVNYLQSGQVDSIQGPEPYDFGYLQGLTACSLVCPQQFAGAEHPLQRSSHLFHGRIRRRQCDAHGQ
jgi:hypothetical protein